MVKWKQPKKSEIAKSKPRDSHGRFIKSSKDEIGYCVATHPKMKGEPSRNAIEFIRKLRRKIKVS